MSSAPSEPPIAAILRRAGHQVPPEVLADLVPAHRLLEAMLARLAGTPPEAEPATVFRPEARP